MSGVSVATWPEVCIGDICEFKYGKSLPEPTRRLGPVSVFGSNGAVGWHDQSISSGPALVVGRKGSFGEVHFSEGPCWPIDTTYFIDRVQANVDLRWLFYRLQGVGLKDLNRAAAVPGLNREDAYRQRLLLPPLPEQRRIAEVLDRAETLRAQRRQALAQLDALAEAIFLDMFGDPVLNPRGWPNPSLGGALSFQQYGPRFYNEQYSDAGTPIVRITDLSEGGHLNFPAMPRLLVSDQDRERYRLHPGDLIFARTGATVGKVALIRAQDPVCIAGAYFITMRFTGALRPGYALAVLRSASVGTIVEMRSRQAAQQNFSGPALRELPMPTPPMELQLEFDRRIAAIEDARLLHTASLKHLNTLFTSLQHRAFRGEL